MEHLQFEEKRLSDIWGVTGIFLLGVLLHFYLGNFSKAIVVAGDELQYYGIARSLFNGYGLYIRGIIRSFQKIGYSLLLAPLFAIEDGVLRVKLIGLLNSFVIMLSLYPVWFIGEQIGLERKMRYLLLGATIIWPETMISMTFMSEVLYWPVCLLFVYLWLINEQRESYKIAVIEGLLCYFGYLTKEIFLALPAAWVSFELIWPFLSRSHYRWKKFGLFFVFISVFSVCHLMMKISFFCGLHSSYMKTLFNISAIFSPYNFAYMFYAFFYYVAAILVTVLIVPFIYPFVYFKSLNEDGRKLFCYVVLFFLIASATIAYTISVREDLGRITPRIHLRYLAPIFVLIFATFFKCMQGLDQDAIETHKERATKLLLVSSMYILFMFKGMGPGSPVDQFALWWYFRLTCLQANPILSLPPEGKMIIHVGAFAVNLFVIAIGAEFYYLLTRKGKKLAMGYFLFTLATMCLADSYWVSRWIIYPQYVYDKSLVSEGTSINTYFKAMGGTPNVLYLTKSSDNRLSKCLDTYLDYKNLFYTKDVFLTAQSKDVVIHLAEAELREPIWGSLYEKLSTIDYLILENSIDLGEKQLANVERVGEISGAHFTVYRNLDPAVIELE